MFQAFRDVFAILVALVISISVTNATPATPHTFPVSENSIDLRQHAWNQGKIFDLKGYWGFSWGQFIAGQDHSPANEIQWTKMNVPGSWDHRYFKGAEDTPTLPPKGYGTYHTRVFVPVELDTLYLYLPDMASAYELWSNGKKLGGNGNIATQKSEEKPAYLPRVYTLYPEQGVVDLYIQTSNFHYIWGGLWYAPRISDQTGLFELKELPQIRSISGSTILVMSAIFCFLLYLSRPQDRKILYFSLFCLAIGIRRLCIDERTLYLIESLDWETLQAIENISMYLMLPFFACYVRHVFPKTIPHRLPIFGWLAAIPFTLLVLLTDVETYAEYNIHFQLTLAIFFPIILIGWFKALIAKHSGAKMFGISLLVFLAAIINDILHYNYIIQTTNMTHIGALAFVLFQIASMMSRYLSNFKQIELLSKSLAEQNKELKQLDQFKDEFLASTSHELKTPLQGIAGLAQTIGQDSHGLTESRQKQIRAIESTAKRLGSLVNDILDTASLKHGKLDINPQAILLKPLIESVIQSLSPLAKDKELKCHYHINEQANRVIADEQRTHQVLFNLIGNAIKYTESGDITIQTERKEQHVLIRISDTGIGIPSHKLSDILKPFETASPQSHKIRGTGLGLPITKKLIELQNGQLRIQSSEGEGTIVEFTLPFSSEVSTSEEHRNGLANQPSLESNDNPNHNDIIQPEDVVVNPFTQGALIYFADDEEVNRELVFSQLTKAGYTVELFANAQQLTKRLALKQPELILLDWMMPGQDGLETCREIRATYNHQQLPIIMLTAKHQTQDIVHALNSGANDYLTKPYHHQELIARVNSQVSCKRLTQTALENERLSEAIRQKEIEQQQLINVLNTSEEGIALLNDELEIEFANHAMSEFFNTSPENINDSAIEHYLSDESVSRLIEFQNSPNTSIELLVEIQNQKGQFDVTVEKGRIGAHGSLSFILKNQDTNKADKATVLSNLTKELAENRERMAQIESTLKQLNDDEDTDKEGTSLSTNKANELVVNTLKSALITWERHTHKTKADLAEKSRCWRVYIDGTTAKTRTLDKYLSVKTLPAKPRWRAVVKTANFVIDNCELSPHEKEELANLARELTDAFS